MVPIRYVYLADNKRQGNQVPSFFLGHSHAGMSQPMVWKEPLRSGYELSRGPHRSLSL